MNDNFDSRLRRLELVSNRGGAVPALIVISDGDTLTLEQQAAIDAAVMSGQQVIRVIGVDMRMDPGAMVTR